MKDLNMDVSETTARKLLKEKLGYTYKLVYKSNPTANSQVAKLKRQYAAHKLISLLASWEGNYQHRRVLPEHHQLY